MTWNVFLTRKAHKQFGRLSKSIQDLVDLAVLDLEECGIHPQGWNTEYASIIATACGIGLLRNIFWKLKYFTSDIDGTHTDERSINY